MEQIAGLQEIETHYSLSDVLDANSILDLREKANKKAAEKMKSKGN